MSGTPRKRPVSDALVALVVVALLIAVVAAVFLSGAGAALYPPDAATYQGVEIRGLYDIVFAVATGIFVVVEALIVWSILRYRRKPTDTELPAQTHGNNLVEVIWTAIPTAIVLGLFVVSYNALKDVDNVAATPDIRVHAIAGQFQWQFEYLDAAGNVIAKQSTPLAENGGGMAVPVDTTVYVTLDSPDVIHAFYVPRFLFKRDVIPGQTNHFEFKLKPEEAGQTFNGQCAELCGTGHHVMLFSVIALDRATFDAWLADLVAKNNATPEPAPSGAAVFTIHAKDIAFDTQALDVAAGQPFAVDFFNDDPAGIPHNVQIRTADGKTVLQDKATIDGGASTTYQYEPLEPGTYTFICSIHPIPAMTGTITVK
jgi:cytochrome c oxidase subunit 2